MAQSASNAGASKIGTSRTAHSFAVIATSAAALMLSACAQDGDSLKSSLLNPPEDTKVASAAKAKANAVPQTELEKATEYWGKKYREKPTELEPALSYAKNLKAMGERQQALAVIQQASVYHGQDKQLASEYGRLALELDQISIAKQMLAIADDPTSPDWRVISARGTVLAKEGKFREAVPLYERALTLSQDQTSVMNNLAMAYAMNGEADKAEGVLRKIEAKGGSAKTRQNLALVLSLQGKFAEAKAVMTPDLGADGAAQNEEFMKRMVKVDRSADWTTSSSTGAKAQRPAKAAAAGADQVWSAPTPAAASASTDIPAVSKAVDTSRDGVLKGMR
jgi:Flp pilus assembly protein TadD